MNLLPHHYETFVLVNPAEEVLRKIDHATTTSLLLQNQESKRYLFTGSLQGDKFRISMKVTRANNYLPLVKGRIESTSNGSLLFITYRLFPSTTIFLVFWNLFILTAGGIWSYLQNHIIFVIASFCLIALIFWIAWSNFNIQLRLTRQLLLQVLS